MPRAASLGDRGRAASATCASIARARRVGVERHAAAQQLGGQVAQHDMGVGHGRLRRRRGRSRPGRDRRRRSAGRRSARRPSTLAIEPPPAPIVTMSTIGSGSGHSPTWPCCVSADAAVLDQADVGAGAADIDGDDVLDAARRGDVARADHAGRRARQRGQRRRAADAWRRPRRRRWTASAAAARSTCSSTQPLLEPRDIGRDARHDHGVEDRRQRALVLAHHRQHVGRGGRPRRPAARARSMSATRALVRGIGEGVQQADRDRLDAERAAGGGGRVDARLVERLDHRAAGADALPDLEHARRPAPAAPASPRRDSWRGAGCPGGRSPAHGGSPRWSPAPPSRPCPRGSCWSRRSCRAARARATARPGRPRPARAGCRSGRPATDRSARSASWRARSGRSRRRAGRCR